MEQKPLPRSIFIKKAGQLTPGECALIAASLPNPRKFNSGKPSNYMFKRQKKILYLMKCVPAFPQKKRRRRKTLSPALQYGYDSNPGMSPFIL